MSNELTKKEENGLATVDPIKLLNEWGVEGINAQDIVIPQILTMQGLSDFVTEGKAAMGEFRDSLSGNLIGSLDKPFEMIPFYVEKKLDIYHEEEGKYAYQRSEALIENPAQLGYNDNLPWEEVVNGIKVKRVRRFNVFCLLTKEVEAGTALPYYFSFKSTSMKEGKKLYTQMYVRNIRAGLTPAGHVMLISGERVKNDKGTFIVPTFSIGRKSTDAEVKECLEWLKMIKANKVKVHEDTDIEEAAVGSSEPIDTGAF